MKDDRQEAHDQIAEIEPCVRVIDDGWNIKLDHRLAQSAKVLALLRINPVASIRDRRDLGRRDNHFSELLLLGLLDKSQKYRLSERQPVLDCFASQPKGRAVEPR